MIKYIKLLLVMISSLSINAYQLKCEQLEGEETQEFIVRALISADIFVHADNDVELRNFITYYNINFDFTSVYNWSEGYSDLDSLHNFKKYRPRVYKGYIKFSYNVYEGPLYKGFGRLDLIIPSNIISNNPQGETFTSYLMMTYMDDHFGGTISLNCKIID